MDHASCSGSSRERQAALRALASRSQSAHVFPRRASYSCPRRGFALLAKGDHSARNPPTSGDRRCRGRGGVPATRRPHAVAVAVLMSCPSRFPSAFDCEAAKLREERKLVLLFALEVLTDLNKLALECRDLLALRREVIAAFR